MSTGSGSPAGKPGCVMGLFGEAPLIQKSTGWLVQGLEVQFKNCNGVFSARQLPVFPINLLFLIYTVKNQYKFFNFWIILCEVHFLV